VGRSLIMACRQLPDNSKKKLNFAAEGVAHAHRVTETLAPFGPHEYSPGTQIKNRQGLVKRFLSNRKKLFNPVEKSYFV